MAAPVPLVAVLAGMDIGIFAVVVHHRAQAGARQYAVPMLTYDGLGSLFFIQADQRA
ncbi:MAG TPA: hypothetical protein VN969_24630 [Streptosporangiaceae bacterium]|jgi:hypothetical protein|nr:hypothetical protein [Streptosporangiaceae bacterium]